MMQNYRNLSNTTDVPHIAPQVPKIEDFEGQY